MKPPIGVTILSATYVKDYSFLFEFTNGVKSLVNFKPIILHGGMNKQFLDKSKFKEIRFNPKTGDIYWGKHWDMCFHIEDYYNETEILP